MEKVMMKEKVVHPVGKRSQSHSIIKHGEEFLLCTLIFGASGISPVTLPFERGLLVKADTTTSSEMNHSSTANIPTTYSGTQMGIGVGGGGSNTSLSDTQASLASYNQKWTNSYDGNEISANTAITTSDGNVTTNNFSDVLTEASITVNGVIYDNFITYPMTINGSSYMGYLTTSNGDFSSDFMIVVQKNSNFSTYNLGANFAYISQSTTSTSTSNTTINASSQSTEEVPQTASSTQQLTSTSSEESSSQSSISPSSSNTSSMGSKNLSNTIPTTYTGSQMSIGAGGGGADASLSSTQSGLASYNQTWSATYEGNQISAHTAVTTADGTITLNNMASVLEQTAITVNGLPYTTYVPYPMTINGKPYAGYLTASNGEFSNDFMIVIENISNFSTYNLGANFAYIDQKTIIAQSNDNSSKQDSDNGNHYGQYKNNKIASADDSQDISITYTNDANIDTVDQVVAESVAVTTSKSSATTQLTNNPNDDGTNNVQQTIILPSTSDSQSSSASESDPTVNLTDKELISSDEVEIPSDYNGTQDTIDFLSGGIDPSLPSTQAGLASSSIKTSTTIDNFSLTFNTSITTFSGMVTADNFASVLQQANITVNGECYNQLTIQEITINGTHYIGYLTTGTGEVNQNFIIAVKALDDFSIAAIKDNFAFITPEQLSVTSDSSETSTAQSETSTTTEQQVIENTIPQISSGDTPLDVQKLSGANTTESAQNLDLTVPITLTSTAIGSIADKVTTTIIQNVSDLNSSMSDDTSESSTSASTENSSTPESINTSKTSSVDESTTIASDSGSSAASDSTAGEQTSVSESANQQETTSTDNETSEQSVIDYLVQEVAIAIAPSITTIVSPEVDAKATTIVSNLVSATDSTTASDDLLDSTNQAIIETAQELADTGQENVVQSIQPATESPAELEKTPDSTTTLEGITQTQEGNTVPQSNSSGDSTSTSSESFSPSDSTNTSETQNTSSDNILPLLQENTLTFSGTTSSSQDTAQYDTALATDTSVEYSSEVSGVDEGEMSNVQYLGTYLTPSTINSNVAYSIEGTSNAVFAGLVNEEETSPAIAIITTDALGETDTETQISISQLPEVEADEIKQGMSELGLIWKPEQVISDQLVTGRIELTINHKTVLSKKVTLKKTMNLGITGATQRHKTLKVAFTHGNLKGMKYIAPTEVNYIREKMGSGIVKTLITRGEIKQIANIGEQNHVSLNQFGTPNIPNQTSITQPSYGLRLSKMEEEYFLNLLYNQIRAQSGFGDFHGMHGDVYLIPVETLVRK